MSKNSLIGKLCQYKSIHHNKVLFTFPVDANIRTVPGTVTMDTEIPFWLWKKFFHSKSFPRPTNYNTAFMFLNNNGSYLISDEKIQSFLVVDSCKFSIKVRNRTIKTRTFLKTLMNNDDQGLICWVDMDWIETYEGYKTYTELIKARLRNKLNI